MTGADAATPAAAPGPLPPIETAEPPALGPSELPGPTAEAASALAEAPPAPPLPTLAEAPPAPPRDALPPALAESPPAPPLDAPPPALAEAPLGALPPAKEPAPALRTSSPAERARARSAGEWSEGAAGLAGARGDLAWARRRSQLDLASTLLFFLVAFVLGPLVVAWLDAEGPLYAVAIAGAIGAAQLFGWWRDRRLQAELARRMLRRDQAIRAAAPLVDDPAVRRPGRDLLALEGWREGLPVELSVTIRLVPGEADAPEDAIVVRVGAPPSSRRPRAVTRHDWLGAPATSVPDSLAGWRAQRSLAALRATELLRRFRLGSLSWGPDGVELRGPADHRLLGRDRLDALLAGAVALAQACGLVAVTRVRVLGEQTAQVACPYCRDELALAERAACLACGTEHHLQCLAEHGRCTVWGCARPWVTARARERTRESS